MTRTKPIVVVGVLILVLAGAAVAVKMIFFPAVKDTYFTISNRSLQRVPPGLVVVRQTHFSDSPKKSSPPGNMQTTVKGAMRMVGRNVTFQQLIAIAYSYNPGRVELPPNPPTGNFDFLVTVPQDPEAHLQSAIRKKLGYTAETETRDASVLALKVEDPNSDGLKISPVTEKDGMNVKNGRLYFTHQPLTTITSGLQSILKTPMVDKSGLTNFYDFSLIWDAHTAQQIQSGTLDNETGKKILAEWGLGLEPDTASIEMLVVKRAL